MPIRYLTGGRCITTAASTCSRRPHGSCRRGSSIPAMTRGRRLELSRLAHTRVRLILRSVTCEFESPARPIQVAFAQPSSNCTDDDSTDGNNDLGRGRRNRYAPRLHRAQRRGADGSRGEPVWWAGIRVSWQTRRPGKGAVVGWRWAMFIRQTPGAWSLRLAESRIGCSGADESATLHVARRNRLATTSQNEYTGVCHIKHLLM